MGLDRQIFLSSMREKRCKNKLFPLAFSCDISCSNELHVNGTIESSFAGVEVHVMKTALGFEGI
jgi:hypothetical protein